MAAKFRIPGGADRTVVMGQTGTGKTTMGAWLLSLQDFKRRPWVALDFKDEELWDEVGDPPMRPLKFGRMPGKRGLYRMHVMPGQEDDLEKWFWKVWAAGNIGIFCDEVSLIKNNNGFKAILRQGRSKQIPVISCTQRPFGVDREVFTEAQFMAIFKLQDKQDYSRVQEFTQDAPIGRPLPKRWFYWFDVVENTLLTLKPVPPPATIAAKLKAKVPISTFLGG